MIKSAKGANHRLIRKLTRVGQSYIPRSMFDARTPHTILVPGRNAFIKTAIMLGSTKNE